MSSLDIRQLSTCCGKPLRWEKVGFNFYEGYCTACAKWQGRCRPDGDAAPMRGGTATELLLLARNAELEAANAELLATLANERGEGEPPCEGWKWEPEESGWALWKDGGGFYVTRTPDGWTWDADRMRSGTPHYDTARDAMRAASGAA